MHVRANAAGSLLGKCQQIVQCRAIKVGTVEEYASYLARIANVQQRVGFEQDHVRPLAHGDLSIPAALGLSIALAAVGLAGGWLLGGPSLTFWLLAYMAITTAYSFRLKAVMVGDAIVLASLYTIRIWIGAIAIGVPLSFCSSYLTYKIIPTFCH